jgi:hypothetical protein
VNAELIKALKDTCEIQLRQVAQKLKVEVKTS